MKLFVSTVREKVFGEGERKRDFSKNQHLAREKLHIHVCVYINVCRCVYIYIYISYFIFLPERESVREYIRIFSLFFDGLRGGFDNIEDSRKRARELKIQIENTHNIRHGLF